MLYLSNLKRKPTHNTFTLQFGTFMKYIVYILITEFKIQSSFFTQRDSRFERDMQMSQTFCVLLSQLLFILGADARDNKVPYSIVKHIIRVDILRAELRSIFPSPVGPRKIASNEPNVTEHPFWIE